MGFTCLATVSNVQAGEPNQLTTAEIVKRIERIPASREHPDVSMYCKYPEFSAVILAYYFSLEHMFLNICGRYPVLAGKVVSARSAITRTYGPSFRQAYDSLKKQGMANLVFGKMVDKYQKDPRVLARLKALTLAEASKYVGKVIEQSKGYALPGDAKAALVGAHPDVYDKPKLWGSSEFSTEWSSGSHAKAEGLNLLIRTPSHWSRKESKDPNTVQEWSRVHKGHLLTMGIIVRKIREGVTTSAFESQLNNKTRAIQIARSMKGTGVTVSYREHVKGYGNRPVVVMNQSMSTVKEGLSLEMQGEIYMFVDGRYFVCIGASAACVPDRNDPKRKRKADFSKFRPGFRVLLSKIKNKTTAR